MQNIEPACEEDVAFETIARFLGGTGPYRRAVGAGAQVVW
jgi:hypothetical protein